MLGARRLIERRILARNVHFSAFEDEATTLPGKVGHQQSSDECHVLE